MSNWRALVALDSTEQKSARIQQHSNTIRSQTRIREPVEYMKQSFTSFDSFKRDLKPAATKTDYRKFLTLMQNHKNSYDSNISHAIEYNKRIIAYKNKE